MVRNRFLANPDNLIKVGIRLCNNLCNNCGAKCCKYRAYRYPPALLRSTHGIRQGGAGRALRRSGRSHWQRRALGQCGDGKECARLRRRRGRQRRRRRPRRRGRKHRRRRRRGGRRPVQNETDASIRTTRWQHSLRVSQDSVVGYCRPREEAARRNAAGSPGVVTPPVPVGVGEVRTARESAARSVAPLWGNEARPATLGVVVGRRDRGKAAATADVLGVGHDLD